MKKRPITTKEELLNMLEAAGEDVESMMAARWKTGFFGGIYGQFDDLFDVIDALQSHYIYYPTLTAWRRTMTEMWEDDYKYDPETFPTFESFLDWMWPEVVITKNGYVRVLEY